MMIHVLKIDGSYDFVKPEILAKQLAQQEIISFKRKDGICLVGEDPVRTEQDEFYLGAERRCQ